MAYRINQVFSGTYDPEVAEYCNTNSLMIVEIEPMDGVRRFQIQALPEQTVAEKLKAIEDAVQDFMDSTAQGMGYDNLSTCISYRFSSVEKWRNEADSAYKWRDAVWTKCHELLNAWQSGEIAELTPDQVIAMLPAIEWD